LQTETDRLVGKLSFEDDEYIVKSIKSKIASNTKSVSAVTEKQEELEKLINSITGIATAPQDVTLTDDEIFSNEIIGREIINAVVGKIIVGNESVSIQLN
jgi:hypothetical protein